MDHALLENTRNDGKTEKKNKRRKEGIERKSVGGVWDDSACVCVEASKRETRKKIRNEG